MNTKKAYFIKLLCLVFFVSIFSSCTTDDVNPTLVDFSASSLTLAEDNGTLTITATLNAPASTKITLPLQITGTATILQDYTASATEITINKGETTGEITLTGIDDNLIEAIETIDVNLGANSSVLMLQNYSLAITILDNDADTDGDGVNDSLDNCPDTPGDINNNGCPYLGFLINEVLYDPENTVLLGDANGDGIRDANADEFIEFFNSGPALDISGYKIFDATGLSSNTPRHTFPAGTIVPANGVIVVFGGGTPTGNFGGALVQTASGGQINITNAGDIITVQNATGGFVVSLDITPFSDNPDESYTRNPDLTGEFVQHSTSDNSGGALFSPGRRTNGTSF